jgi:hypothetical protein
MVGITITEGTTMDTMTIMGITKDLMILTGIMEAHLDLPVLLGLMIITGTTMARLVLLPVLLGLLPVLLGLLPVRLGLLITTGITMARLVLLPVLLGLLPVRLGLLITTGITIPRLGLLIVTGTTVARLGLLPVLMGLLTVRLGLMITTGITITRLGLMIVTGTTMARLVLLPGLHSSSRFAEAAVTVLTVTAATRLRIHLIVTTRILLPFPPLPPRVVATRNRRIAATTPTVAKTRSLQPSLMTPQKRTASRRNLCKPISWKCRMLLCRKSVSSRSPETRSVS